MLDKIGRLLCGQQLDELTKRTDLLEDYIIKLSREISELKALQETGAEIVDTDKKFINRDGLYSYRHYKLRRTNEQEE